MCRCCNKCCCSCRCCCPPAPPNPPAPPALYTVVYNANGGNGSFADYAGRTYVVKSDTEAGISRAGYTFKGWNTLPDGSGTSYTPGQLIRLHQSITLYAQWEQIPVTYSVTYLPNEGGTGGSVDSGLTPGAAYTVKNVTSAGITPNLGETFGDWNTLADGSGSSYSAGEVINLTSDIMLYAQWLIT